MDLIHELFALDHYHRHFFVDCLHQGDRKQSSQVRLCGEPVSSFRSLASNNRLERASIKEIVVKREE